MLCSPDVHENECCKKAQRVSEGFNSRAMPRRYSHGACAPKANPLSVLQPRPPCRYFNRSPTGIPITAIPESPPPQRNAIEAENAAAPVLWWPRCLNPGEYPNTRSPPAIARGPPPLPSEWFPRVLPRGSPVPSERVCSRGPRLFSRRRASAHGSYLNREQTSWIGVG